MKYSPPVFNYCKKKLVVYFGSGLFALQTMPFQGLQRPTAQSAILYIVVSPRYTARSTPLGTLAITQTTLPASTSLSAFQTNKCELLSRTSNWKATGQSKYKLILLQNKRELKYYHICSWNGRRLAPTICRVPNKNHAILDVRFNSVFPHP